jgi:hypothetical protein
MNLRLSWRPELANFGTLAARRSGPSLPCHCGVSCPPGVVMNCSNWLFTFSPYLATGPNKGFWGLRLSGALVSPRNTVEHDTAQGKAAVLTAPIRSSIIIFNEIPDRRVLQPAHVTVFLEVSAVHFNATRPGCGRSGISKRHRPNLAIDLPDRSSPVARTPSSIAAAHLFLVPP